VRLVDDDRVVAGREAAHLLEHEGKLLQRGDDDAGLLASERLGKLAGVPVDLHHHAAGVLELVDRVLKLPVEDDPVGNHHDLVEHLPVLRAVQRRQPVRRPSDRVRPPRPR
jgi:hypothetical protein